MFQDFVEFLVKEIVKNPDDVVITEEQEGTVVRVKIQANQEDMGLLIGKEGRTINGLRALARAKAIKEEVKVYVDILEDDKEEVVEEMDAEAEVEEILNELNEEE